MKIILIVVLIACCTYIGYGFSRYYKNRKKFFSDLVLLMDKLKLEINFSKEKIGDIIKNFEPFSKHTGYICNNFLEILKNNEFNESKLFENIVFLKTEEKNVIQSFFKSLGRFDAQNQTKQILFFQEEIKRYEKSATEFCDKYGNMFVKLGLIIGILIALIVV